MALKSRPHWKAAGKASAATRETISPPLSPSSVILESAFESELAAQVAALNAEKHESSTGKHPEAEVSLLLSPYGEFLSSRPLPDAPL